MTNPTERKQQAERITVIGAVIDGLLGIIKVVGGSLFHSSALVVDGIHSLSDLLTDFLVVVLIRYSNQAPDQDHPWGHARFETAGTVMLGGLLIAVAGAIFYDSILAIWASDFVTPEWPALVAAAISVLAKESIYRYTLAVGQRIKSDLIIANAWHSRTDALSSIVVLVGVAAAMSGLQWLDTVAAAVVAVMIAKVGWDLCWENVRELVDTSLPEEDVEALKTCVMAVDDVCNVHSFKSRKMGHQILLEMHLQVASELSASEGHFIGCRAVDALKHQFSDIGHVIFHIDTYDDEDTDDAPETELPLRQQVLDLIQPKLPEQLVTAPLELRLHYYRHHLAIELAFQQADLDAAGVNPQTLQQQLQQELRSHPWWSQLTVASLAVSDPSKVS